MKLLTLDEIAHRLNINTTVLMRLIRNRDLPSVLLDGKENIVEATWQEMVKTGKYPEHCERKVRESDFEQWCEDNRGLMKAIEHYNSCNRDTAPDS